MSLRSSLQLSEHQSLLSAINSDDDRTVRQRVTASRKDALFSETIAKHKRHVQLLQDRVNELESQSRKDDPRLTMALECIDQLRTSVRTRDKQHTLAMETTAKLNDELKQMKEENENLKKVIDTLKAEISELHRARQLTQPIIVENQPSKVSGRVWLWTLRYWQARNSAIPINHAAKLHTLSQSTHPPSTIVYSLKSDSCDYGDINIDEDETSSKEDDDDDDNDDHQSHTHHHSISQDQSSNPTRSKRNNDKDERHTRSRPTVIQHLSDYDLEASSVSSGTADVTNKSSEIVAQSTIDDPSHTLHPPSHPPSHPPQSQPRPDELSDKRSSLVSTDGESDTIAFPTVVDLEVECTAEEMEEMLSWILMRYFPCASEGQPLWKTVDEWSRDGTVKELIQIVKEFRNQVKGVYSETNSNQSVSSSEDRCRKYNSVRRHRQREKSMELFVWTFKVGENDSKLTTETIPETPDTSRASLVGMQLDMGETTPISVICEQSDGCAKESCSMFGDLDEKDTVSYNRQSSEEMSTMRVIMPKLVSNTAVFNGGSDCCSSSSKSSDCSAADQLIQNILSHRQHPTRPESQTQRLEVPPSTDLRHNNLGDVTNEHGMEKKFWIVGDVTSNDKQHELNSVPSSSDDTPTVGNVDFTSYDKV